MIWKIKLCGYAHFIIKPSNISELKSIINTYYKNKSKNKYIIIGTVELNINEYNSLCSCLIAKDYNFLKPFYKKLYCSEDMIHYYVLVTIKNNSYEGILITKEVFIVNIVFMAKIVFYKLIYNHNFFTLEVRI